MKHQSLIRSSALDGYEKLVTELHGELDALLAEYGLCSDDLSAQYKDI